MTNEHFFACHNRLQGLGEVYEEQYVRSVVGNTSEDKDEKIRNEARTIFQVGVCLRRCVCLSTPIEHCVPSKASLYQCTVLPESGKTPVCDGLFLYYSLTSQALVGKPDALTHLHSAPNA